MYFMPDILRRLLQGSVGQCGPSSFAVLSRQQRREAGQSLALATGSRNAASSRSAHHVMLCPQQQLHIQPPREYFPRIPPCEQARKIKMGLEEQTQVNVFSWSAATFGQRIRERSSWWHCLVLPSQAPSPSLALGADIPRAEVGIWVSRFNSACPHTLQGKKR